MIGDDILSDGIRAAALVRDVLRLVKPLVEKLESAGALLEYPELRLNCSTQSMEFTSGLALKRSIFGAKYLKLKIPQPVKAHLHSLLPYRPLEDKIHIISDGIAIDRQCLKDTDNKFRMELEYALEGRKAVGGLVYTSSPAETLSEDPDSEIERFWLHAELKTVKWLEEIYENVRLEDVDVLVDVSMRDDIKEVISPDLRFEIMMMAKLQSHDRNEQARAITYRRAHPMPKFKGDVFDVMNRTQELFRPSRFRSYLQLDGPFRLTKCQRGIRLPDMYLPLDLPRSMMVFSSTDLTLEEPAREGKLTYRKSDFMKKLDKILRG